MQPILLFYLEFIEKENCPQKLLSVIHATADTKIFRAECIDESFVNTKKYINNSGVEIVFENMVVSHNSLHVKKLLKYIHYTKAHGLRNHSFSLITCF